MYLFLSVPHAYRTLLIPQAVNGSRETVLQICWKLHFETAANVTSLTTRAPGPTAVQPDFFRCR